MTFTVYYIHGADQFIIPQLKHYDFIIVGQGIAGSLLSMALLDKEKNVLVIDQPDQNISSTVAAGICNPLVLKRFTKGWMADTTWPIANAHYRRLEGQLNTSFFTPVHITRLFSSVSEQNDWHARLNDEAFAPYLETTEQIEISADHFHMDFGYGTVSAAAQLQTNALMLAVQKKLLLEGSYREDTLEWIDVALEKDQVRWKDATANTLVYCNGLHAQHHPLFEVLPFAPTKGELIRLKIPGLELKSMIHSSVFLLPQADGTFLCGSTYNRNDLDNIPSSAGREQLESQLQKFLKLPYKIVGHWAGVRPTTRDRRPFVGLHPEFSQVGIIGGLGSRGAILAPWLVESFCQHVLEETTLNSEIDIGKYY